MANRNKIILKQANEALSKGDYEGFLDYCTDDTKWRFVGDQILYGKEAVRKWMKQEYIEPPKNEVKQLIAEEDCLTVLGHITILNKDGSTSEYEYCDVWRFHKGKMSELMAFVIEPNDLESS